MRPVIESAMKDAGSSANLYFVHRPFPTIHKFAVAAASASIIAADEGKFWPMYDELYSHQDDLEPGNYDEYAKNVGVNPKKAASAFQDKQITARIDETSAFCDKLGVNETPTLIIRDNKSGQVVAVAGGAVDITKALKNAPWLAQHTTASAK
jgi:protein-disulfide isomerase